MSRATGGAGPAGWAEALARRAPRVLDPAAMHRLLVVAAHPDDETLAAGGLMRAVQSAGGTVELVVATDGEAAFPGLDRAGRVDLAGTRRAELYRSLQVHGLGSVPVHWLGMPDSALDDGQLAEALRPMLRDVDAYLAPWIDDPHPDHAAAGRAASAAAPVHVHGWGYPIWMWAWQDPDDAHIPWSQASHHVMGADERERKRRAVACFASQLTPGPNGETPILPAEVLAYFDTDRELFFRVPPQGSAPRQRFDTLYAEGTGDPWQTRSSWYEQRKRAVCLACLPRRRYRHAAEPGCGTGELTRALAARCDRLTASDYAPLAVDATLAATDGLAGVTVAELSLPASGTLPDGIDLAVLSEVLYYLSPDDVAATVDRLADALVPGGDVLLAHWRSWPAEAPRDADATHRQLLTDPRFEQLVEHVDEEFLLHVARRR